MANESTNQHWEVVANGVKCEILSARDLWGYALIYFQWCDANPIQKPELIRAGADSGQIYNVPIPRPYTIHGLCIHLGITREYLYSIANSKNMDDYKTAATKIIEIIYTQKLEYAMAGIFSAVVAAKELGLGNAAANVAQSPAINITVEEGPKLLKDERDVELPEDKR